MISLPRKEGNLVIQEPQMKHTIQKKKFLYSDMSALLEFVSSAKAQVKSTEVSTCGYSYHTQHSQILAAIRAKFK